MTVDPREEDPRVYACSGGATRRAALAAMGSTMLAGAALSGCSVVRQVGSAVGVGNDVTVRSDSMDPTIVAGEVIAVGWLTPGSYRPRRQDLVLVHPTADYRGMKQSGLIVRRVIAIPGDKVSCYDGPLTLNGAPLREPYLHQGDAPSTLTFDVTVPAGCLWLLGDHRAIAIDCRYFVSGPHNGAIPIANVTGLYRHKE